VLLQYQEVEWDFNRWPNFTPREFACTCKICNGELYWDEASFDAIQLLRTLLGRPVHINSGHRCAAHNKSVGGKRLSKHLEIAFDISTKGHDREVLLAKAIHAGFTGVGMYVVFMHLDLGRQRYWFGGGEAQQIWMPIMNKVGL
jgi:hypothetical protein